MKKYLFTLLVVVTCQHFISAQVNYTANDTVTPYEGYFRPGINFDYYPPYTNEQLGNIAAGNPAVGLTGIGARASRPALRESFVEEYGYDWDVQTFQHYANLDMKELTLIIGFPTDAHKEDSSYCSTGAKSQMFANLYTPIWDGGANGTPYNDDNYLAAYMYKLVSLYKNDIKYWEIWNEPGFDHSYVQGWQPEGSPNTNWWDADPDPCINHFKAPIQEFVRTLRISYDIIKTVDPDAYITLAGVGYESFLDAVLRNTDNPDAGAVTAEYPLKGGAYFDCMGFHTYPDIDGSVRYWSNDIQAFVYERHSDAAALGVQTRKLLYENRLALYGYDDVQYPKKEWIITELNSPRIAFTNNTMASNESQVNYITKATVFALKNDIRSMHPYQLADRATLSDAAGEFDLLGMYLNFNWTEPYGDIVKTDEGIAYSTTTKFVYKTTYDPAKTAVMNLPAELDGIALYDAANLRYKYILWAKTTTDLSEAASGTYSFPASFGIDSLIRRDWDFSNTYASSTISPTDIALTGRPIYLMEPSSVQSTLTATCPNDTIIIGSAEQVVLTWDLPNSTSTCPIDVVTAAQTSGPNPGFTSPWTTGFTIGYQITDDCDNMTTCEFDIQGIVQEPELSIICPDDIVVSIAGNAGIEVSWNEDDIIVNANCGSISAMQINGPDNGSVFPVGTTQIQYLGLSVTCRDSLTLTENCSFNIVVNSSGSGSSVLTTNCPSDTTIIGSETEVALTWAIPTAVTTCANPDINITQTNGPAMGAVYNETTTSIISYSLTDSCGNSSSCNFTVTGQLLVTAPVISITCPDDILIEIPSSQTGAYASWDENDVVVSTNCGSPSITQVLGDPSGSLFLVGQHVIKYAGISQCNDNSISALCDFNVIVSQIGGSILTVDCPADTTIMGSETEVTLTWSLPSAISTCSNPDVTITQTDGPDMGTSYAANIFETINYHLVDSCGNSSDCSFTVTGQLAITPEMNVSCPGDIEVTITAPDSTAVVTWDEADITATSNCGTPVITQILGDTSGSAFPVGENIIKYVGIAQCNSSTSVSDVCSFTITVNQLVGTETLSAFKKFEMYPNPTNDIVNIDIASKQGEDISLEVYDALGRLVLTKNYSFKSGHLKTSLNLGHLANGNYMLKVKTPTEFGSRRITVEK